MKKILWTLIAAVITTTALAQLTQPPGGITGNLAPWAGGNGTSGQILTSRGVSLAPTFQANTGSTPPGADTQVIYNSAGAFGANSGLTYDGTNVLTTTRFKLSATTGSASGNSLYLSNTNTVAMSSGGTQGLLLSGSALQFGNATTNPTFAFLGTGAATFSGGIIGLNLQLTSATAPTSPGFSRPAANTIGITGALTSLGTKFTAAGTGCTVGTTVGGASAGTFALAAGPCTSVAVTLNGATGATSTTGWSCWASDTTATTVLISQSATSTTTATFTIPAGAGATDVIRFGCIGY